MRLIDADALVKHCNGNPFITDSVKSYVQISVATMQTIEERKTGKWIWKTLDVYKCSECETETHVDECMEEPIYNFCPYCGARLVQEGEEP